MHEREQPEVAELVLIAVVMEKRAEVEVAVVLCVNSGKYCVAG